ncbi:Dph6-related ATP pyrophosphatase [Sediminicola luteus]|uniref:ATP-binding protein n=1 Tax=Sediminicola luteus TaxID=319238 RepID=A0A2A4G9E0_9FLAO|nr:ATP-binding protein [Sediminicola luteus]PCE65031.1 ATP-binding protein [Sediminicola luteus]
MKKAYFNWSTGKDSALALYKIQQGSKLQVDRLLTIVNTDFDRVSMHGLRNGLLERQAQALKLPLQKVALAGNVSMVTYDAVMRKTMEELYSEGYRDTVFGDIFLEDLRAYRDGKLAEVGVKGHYPLWKKDTKTLMTEFLDLGFKAITVCVNAKLLDASFCGRELDASFLSDLPDGIDPCGENGEFHTFVYDGPIFNRAVDFKMGEIVKKSYTPSSDGEDCYQVEVSWDNAFWYCDLLP